MRLIDHPVIFNKQKGRQQQVEDTLTDDGSWSGTDVDVGRQLQRWAAASGECERKAGLPEPPTKMSEQKSSGRTFCYRSLSLQRGSWPKTILQSSCLLWNADVSAKRMLLYLDTGWERQCAVNVFGKSSAVRKRCVTYLPHPVLMKWKTAWRCWTPQSYHEFCSKHSFTAMSRVSPNISQIKTKRINCSSARPENYSKKEAQINPKTVNSWFLQFPYHVNRMYVLLVKCPDRGLSPSFYSERYLIWMENTCESLQPFQESMSQRVHPEVCTALRTDPETPELCQALQASLGMLKWTLRREE